MARLLRVDVFDSDEVAIVHLVLRSRPDVVEQWDDHLVH